MKKSILILFLIAMSITSFGQEIPFKKVELYDSIVLASQMKQLATRCDTLNLSELDLFKFKLIKGNYNEALITFQKIIKETPTDQRQYLDVYMHYVEAKLSNSFNDAFKKSYRKYVKNSNDMQVINLDKALIIRDPTDYYVGNFKNTYQNITSDTISQEITIDLVKKY